MIGRFVIHVPSGVVARVVGVDLKRNLAILRIAFDQTVSYPISECREVTS